MKDLVIKVDESVVEDIQGKDLKAQAMKEVIMNLLEMHALDDSDILLSSKVFLGYQDKLIEAKREFELAKDTMLNNLFKKDVQQNIIKWQLNYADCTLEYTMK